LWNLNPGLLKLFAWSKDFNPRLQHNTSAQVWVRLYGLSQEYWHKNILFTIASSVGTPICIDVVTAKPMHERTFGQFARVLVDMDLSQPLRYKVLVERKGFAFFVEIEYENVPEFCSECQIIGHHVDNCRRWGKLEESKLSKEVINKKNPSVVPQKTYVRTNVDIPQQSKANKVINVEVETINVEELSDNATQGKTKENENDGNVIPILGQKSPPQGKTIESENQANDIPNLEQVSSQQEKSKEKEKEVRDTPNKEQDIPHQQQSFYKEQTILCPVAIFKDQDIQLEKELNVNVIDGVVQEVSD
jgi:hypothetical protein